MPRPWNLRDLGGHETPNGRLRTGRIWRSNELVDLSEDGNLALAEAGIRTVIDLREPAERERRGSDLNEQVVTRTVPILGTHDLPPRAHTTEGMCFWILEERSPQITEAVRVLADPGNHPAVVFCSSGKDRTGMVSATLLSALGVSDDDVADDFQQTELLMPDVHMERAIEAAAELGVDEQSVRVGMGTPRQVMLDVLARIREQHGTTAEYLMAHGLTSTELDDLRRAVIEPSP